MSEDDLEQLMSEPPGGEQHGRKRVRGRWVSLDPAEHDAYEVDLWVDHPPEPVRRSAKPEDTIRHGTFAAYTNDRCRCEECRRANRDHQRSRRQR